MAENLTLYLGRRASGKSTQAAVDAQRKAREDELVILHDQMRGAPEGIGTVCDSMLQLRIAAESGTVLVVRNVSLEELFTWCMRHARGMPNGIRLILDEGGMLTTEEEQSKIKRRIRVMAATARHNKVKLGLVVQSLVLVDYQLVQSADRVCLFALIGRYEAQKLIDCQVPEKIARNLSTLEDWQYWCGTPGRPEGEWMLFQTRMPVQRQASSW